MVFLLLYAFREWLGIKLELQKNFRNFEKCLSVQYQLTPAPILHTPMITPIPKVYFGVKKVYNLKQLLTTHPP